MLKSWMQIKNKEKYFKQADQGKEEKMITLKRIALNIALLGFLLGGGLCFAASNEIGRDGAYVAYDNGIVRDTGTGLEWVVGPDRDTDWNEARSWVKSLNLDGGGWRMPATDELQGLYKKGAGPRNMTPLLKTNGWWAWSGETISTSSTALNPKSSLKEGRVMFLLGNRRWADRGYSFNGRAFAVRSLKDEKR